MSAEKELLRRFVYVQRTCVANLPIEIWQKRIELKKTLKCFTVVDKCPYVVYNVVHIHRVTG